MLTRAFHNWERRLAAAAENRTVRPFDWGLEWVPDLPDVLGDPAVRLMAWADEALSRSQDFFAVTPGEYSVDGDRLTFQSAVVTPHPENNTVIARFFPASHERQKTRGPRDAAVERGCGGACRSLPLAESIRAVGAAAQPPLSRGAHAAGTQARRLHRQRQRRADHCHQPAGRSRCAPLHRLAAPAGIRIDRRARHQPRLVPGDVDDGARTTCEGSGAQSHFAVLRRRHLGGTLDRARASNHSTATSTSKRCGGSGCRSRRCRIWIESWTARRCLSMRCTT